MKEQQGVVVYESNMSLRAFGQGVPGRVRRSRSLIALRVRGNSEVAYKKHEFKSR